MKGDLFETLKNLQKKSHKAGKNLHKKFLVMGRTRTRPSAWQTSKILKKLDAEEATETKACGTTSFQKKSTKNLFKSDVQIEHVLAKVPVKKLLRRRSKPPAETTER